MLYEEPTHDQLVAELDPVQHGRDAGEQNLPRPDAERDAHERYINDSLLQYRDRAEEQFHHIVQQTREDEHKLLSYPWASLMDDAVRDAEHQADQALAGDHVKHARLEMNRRRDDLARFRKDHDLHHEPNYPTTHQHAVTVFLLLACFIVETVVNANFLSAGSARGLLGGWILAFSFSLLNIGVSFFPFGAAVRQIHHVQPVHQAVGWLCGTFWFSLVVLVNLTLGHFRAASEEAAATGEVDPLQIGRTAISAFMDSPLGLGDVQSFLVAGLGIFFAALALYKGYRWDEPYPGFGRKHRKLIDAHGKYQVLIEEMVGVLGDQRLEAVRSIEGIAQQVRQQPVQLAKYRKTRARSARQYNEMIDRLETTGMDIVTQYREANHAVRTDRTVPVCHQTAWTLGLAPAPVEEASDQAGYTAAVPVELDRVRQQHCDRLQEIFDAHKVSLRNPDEAPVRQGPLRLQAAPALRAVGARAPLRALPQPSSGDPPSPTPPTPPAGGSRKGE